MTFRFMRQLLTVCLLILAAFPSRAETVPSASVREALSRGLSMADQGQWALALRHFKRAHAQAPENPAVLLNLALAYDRMGGRDAVSVAWYRAYLAADPQGQTAAQVRDRVAVLSTTLEVRIQQILDVASRIAGEIQDPSAKAVLVSWLMRAYAEFGDAPAAERVLAINMTGPNRPHGWGRAHIAALQARRGNVPLALSEAGRIQNKSIQSWALAEIAVEQAAKRDFDGALATVDGIKAPPEKAYALSRIAILRARVGDVGGLTAVIDRIDERHVVFRAQAIATLATAKARNGDLEGAKEDIVAAESLSVSLGSFNDRVDLQSLLCVARAAADPTMAPSTAVATMTDGRGRDRALRDIAALRGDIGLAETYDWSARAHEIEDNPALGDLNGAVESAKGKAPADSGLALAKVAYEASRALGRLSGL